MAIKYIFLDLWLTVRCGRWRVCRSRVYGLIPGTKALGWFWQYTVECRRTGERINCNSKRIAEGACAAENDLRGTSASGDQRLSNDEPSTP